MSGSATIHAHVSTDPIITNRTYMAAGKGGRNRSRAPLYDALVRWDLSQGERLSAIVSGLAESWEVDLTLLSVKK
jgi:ABC-type transport system substrate-binding protein